MAFCEVSQEQTPGSAAYAGDFGFKVLTSSDPAEKTKKLNAEIANGRLAMMAIIGMFFQAGIGSCAHIVCYNSTRKRNTTKSVAERVQQCRASAQQNQHRWKKNHNSVSIRMVCSEFLKFISCQPRFQHTALFDCLILFQHTAQYSAMSPLYLLLLAQKVSCRMCREWIVSWCDMNRLYNWYNAVETCTKKWCYSFVY